MLFRSGHNLNLSIWSRLSQVICTLLKQVKPSQANTNWKALANGTGVSGILPVPVPVAGFTHHKGTQVSLGTYLSWVFLISIGKIIKELLFIYQYDPNCHPMAAPHHLQHLLI